LRRRSGSPWSSRFRSEWADAGRPVGIKFSHASAIVERGSGSTQDKITRLRDAGIIVVDNPNETPQRFLELKKQEN